MEKCNSSKAWKGQIAEGYVCAGYESGTRSLCSVRFFLLILYFFFWPLYYLFFFDIQILITPLVSSNSSCKTQSPSCKTTFSVMRR